MKHVLPQDDPTRKAAPMCRGLLDYFPAALFAVAGHSYQGDRKHNPGKPEGADPHWARGKSTDHADCQLRHLAERGTDPAYHLRANAWRALALLQEYLEQHEGAAPGLGSRFPTEPEPPAAGALREDVLERLSDKASAWPENVVPFRRTKERLA